ncbi:MAG: hypothetical protein KBA33_05550 [Cloacibacterium sp.]|nr:hypothetical protein [Cloacibacterium sp.]
MKLQILCTVICIFSFVFVSSQDSLQVKKIQKQTDTTSLNKLKKNVKSEERATKELKCKAKKLNTPFKGNINGKEYQLKKIDKKKNIPIYYTTYGNENKNPKLEESQPQKIINKPTTSPSIPKNVKDSTKN